MSLSAAFNVESFKLRKSKILFFTIAACVLISVMIGFFIYISLHPELFNDNSLIGTKASLFAITTWQAYFTLMLQMIVFMGFILYGFLTIWVFGREYSDRTLKDLLALPISRTSILLSKFIVASIWSFILSMVLFICSILIGFAINLHGWSTDVAFHVLFYYTLASVLAILITAPVALVASIGKGYLAPFGYIITVTVLAQFINTGLPGLDPYVPWILPALVSQSGVPSTVPLPALNLLSYLIFFGTVLLGVFGTIYYWNYTDQF